MANAKFHRRLHWGLGIRFPGLSMPVIGSTICGVEDFTHRFDCKPTIPHLEGDMRVNGRTTLLIVHLPHSILGQVCLLETEVNACKKRRNAHSECPQKHKMPIVITGFDKPVHRSGVDFARVLPGGIGYRCVDNSAPQKA